MLNLRKVMGAKPKPHVDAQLEKLFTPWGEALDEDHVWEEHPTPQFERDEFLPLNGRWTCAFTSSGHDSHADLEAVAAAAEPPAPAAFSQPIIVPFSPEAPLSGVNRQLQPDELLWYRRAFPTPELGASGRCLLHFQAVDYACAVRVNGQLAGTHKGGYTPFTLDVTDMLNLPQNIPANLSPTDAAHPPAGSAGEHVSSENELVVCVADPSEFGGQLRGKQRFDRGDIWYTAQSGIWQSVWLEVVPAAHIERLQVEADLTSGIIVVGAQVSEPANMSSQPGAGRMLRVNVFDADGELVASGRARVEGRTAAVGMRVEHVHPWTQKDPYLYHLRVTYGEDVVVSYTAFRTVSRGRDAAGHPCVMLNGEPLFVKGVLDQAYWSDGLMTAPSDAALVFDIEQMRAAGFNLMRKHIKIECERWYYHCDRLGMLVLQDMVQGGEAEIRTWDWSYKPTLFKASWNRFRDDVPRAWERLGVGGPAGERYREEWTRTCRETVELLRGHPSIIGWSLFNEGWGQFCARDACDLVRAIDPSRLVDAVSGWYDQGYGDFASVHNYFRELDVWPDKRGRAFLVSEFGGFSHRVDGHSSLPECYGYEVYDDLAAWQRAVRELLAHMDSLATRGLAGYIYTQVSDIEEETNGILTYDRRVNKLLPPQAPS